ncbi:MAG: phytoene desaturase family protein [Spirochaetaceae bacterium]
MDADVVFVGTGHNALVTAAYLAKWGYKVLMFERREDIGGAVCTREMFGGYRMDIGGSVHFMIHHTPIVSDLKLDRYGLEYIPLDPFMSAPFEDGSVIHFHRDLDTTCESIAGVNEADAEHYRAFIRKWQPLNKAVFELFLEEPTPSAIGRRLFLRRLHASRRDRKEIMRRLLFSYGRLLRETFESEKLRAALAWWGAQSGPPPIDAVSAEFVGWHSMIHLRGPARPRGGSGMLTQALARYIEDHGGRIRTGTPIRRILTEGDRAVGVETTDGDRFTAKRVVSSAHVWVTFLELLEHWTPPELRRRVGGIHVGNGFGMVLRSALDAPPEYRVESSSAAAVRRGIQLLCPSMRYLDDAYADYLKGYPSEHPAAIGMTFSEVDPTLTPEGKALLFVWGQYYPHDLRGGADWDAIANREARKLLRVVDRFAPGTSNKVRDTYVQTPKTIAELHNMPKANVMHVEMLIDQMFMFRPIPELSRYETPLQGLFLANAGMHPGGGIFGAPGRNCARVVRRSLEPLPRRLIRGR